MTSDNECSPVSHISDNIVENLLLLFNVTSLILTKAILFPLIGSCWFSVLWMMVIYSRIMKKGDPGKLILIKSTDFKHLIEREVLLLMHMYETLIATRLLVRSLMSNFCTDLPYFTMHIHTHKAFIN